MESGEEILQILIRSSSVLSRPWAHHRTAPCWKSTAGSRLPLPRGTYPEGYALQPVRMSQKSKGTLPVTARAAYIS